MDNRSEKKESAGISGIDVRIMISVGICCLTATVMKTMGFLFTINEMHIEIIQTMTSCISCLLVCQDNVDISMKAGKNRLTITAIGGIVGMFVAFIDTMVGDKWLMVAMVAIGVLITLLLCKVAKVPYINARIGGVTFVLVACTLSGSARLWYALFRFISTLYGVVIVLVVTWTMSVINEKKQ